MLYYKVYTYEFEYDYEDGDPTERTIHEPMKIIREAIRQTARSHAPLYDLLEEQAIPHHFTYRSSSYAETQLRYHNGDASRPTKLWVLQEYVELAIPNHDVGVQIRLACGLKPIRVDSDRTPEEAEQTA